MTPIHAEAVNVYDETGLTPRQLADQRAELLAALDQLEKTASKINAMQHAGNPVPPEEWAALYSDCGFAKAVIAKVKGKTR